MHFSNGRFSNEETGFSGPVVVGGLLGAAGEKKRENQMFLQDYIPLHRLKVKISTKFRKTFSHFFVNFLRTRYFQTVFVDFFTDFDEIFSEFRQIS